MCVIVFACVSTFALVYGCAFWKYLMSVVQCVVVMRTIIPSQHDVGWDGGVPVYSVLLESFSVCESKITIGLKMWVKVHV